MAWGLAITIDMAVETFNKICKYFKIGYYKHANHLIPHKNSIISSGHKWKHNSGMFIFVYIQQYRYRMMVCPNTLKINFSRINQIKTDVRINWTIYCTCFARLPSTIIKTINLSHISLGFGGVMWLLIFDSSAISKRCCHPHSSSLK